MHLFAESGIGSEMNTGLYKAKQLEATAGRASYLGCARGSLGKAGGRSAIFDHGGCGRVLG